MSHETPNSYNQPLYENGSMPEAASTEYTTPVEDDKPEKKKKTGIKVAAGLGVAALVGAGAAIFAPKVFGGEEEAPQAGTDPVATGEANPGEQESEVKSPEDIESELAEEQEKGGGIPKNAEGVPANELSPSELTKFVTIDADKYNTPRAIMERYQDIENAWINSGNDKEAADLLNKYLDGDGTRDGIHDLARDYSRPYDKAVENGLLSSDWKEDQELKTYVDGMTDVHGSVTNNYMLTGSGINSFNNLEGYYRVSEYDLNDMEVLANSDDMIRVQAPFVEHDNADKNTVEQSGHGVEGKTGSSTFTFVKQNGRWLLASR